MMLKTTVGDHLAGQWSHRDGEGLRVRAGDTVEISFPFRNQLVPGTYFANAGMFSSAEGEFTIIHRLLDALMFKVVPFEHSEETRGSVNLRPDGARVEIRVTERAAGEGKAAASL